MLKLLRTQAKRTYDRYNRVFTRAKELARQTLEPRRSWRRIEVGRELAVDRSLQLESQNGYLRFDRSSFGSTDALVAAGREIYRRSLTAGTGAPAADKDYFHNIMRREDLEAYPAILSFAMNRELLGTLAAYFGFLPELCSVGLMLSTRSDQRIGSQHGHFDAKDSHHVKVIVAVEDVVDENGPFEFLTARDSMIVREKHRLVHGFGGRFDDDTLLKIVPRDRFVKMTSRAGDGMIVDTSNCLHFGSRVERGFRLLWFVHFATFADYQKMTSTGNGAILFANRPDRARFSYDGVTKLALSVRGD